MMVIKEDFHGIEQQLMIKVLEYMETQGNAKVFTAADPRFVTSNHYLMPPAFLTHSLIHHSKIGVKIFKLG